MPKRVFFWILVGPPIASIPVGMAGRLALDWSWLTVVGVQTVVMVVGWIGAIRIYRSSRRRSEWDKELRDWAK